MKINSTHNANPTGNSGILIVTDLPEEGVAIRKLLTPDMGEYWCADTDGDGVRLFAEKRPRVLILSFEEIGKAELFYLGLHRQCPQIQDIPHRSLLFCTNKEAEAAFHLCMKGIVDDYMVNRPLYDLFRLRLSIHQALDISVLKQQSNGLRRRLADVGDDLRHLDEHMGKTLATGKELRQETLHAFREFTSRMTSDLAQFEERLLESGLDNAVKVLDHTALQQQLDQLPHKNMEVEKLHVEKKMQDAEAWAKKADKGFRQQVEPLRKTEFPPARPEVMVVDDENVYRELIIDVLGESDFRVSGAESGQAALTGLKNRQPDIILLDFQMPGLNGLETLRRIQADPKLNSIPIIMLTGDSEKTLVRECIMAGAVDFIVKPSNRATLIAKIRVHLHHA
ncbi:MAG: response regulator [Nitrosomonadales bacterium]|nr:response regulator [Nitrosomonadales bacterium]